MEPSLTHLREHTGPVLHLLSGPYVTFAGIRRETSEAARCLVAFVALHHRGMDLDLLPGWFGDWTLMERERLQQRMLHALEVLSELGVEPSAAVGPLPHPAAAPLLRRVAAG